MSLPTEFTIPIFHLEILRRETRSEVAKWLNTSPKDPDGNTIIAIKQSFFAKPTPEASIGLQAEASVLGHYDAFVMAPEDVQPIAARNGQIQPVWTGYIQSDDLRGYRDAHFHLSHDETYLRLANSSLLAIVQKPVSRVNIYHFANASIVTCSANPGQIELEQANATDIENAMCSLVIPRNDSNHARLAVTKDVDCITKHLTSIFEQSHQNDHRHNPRLPRSQDIA